MNTYRSLSTRNMGTYLATRICRIGYGNEFCISSFELVIVEVLSPQKKELDFLICSPHHDHTIP